SDAQPRLLGEWRAEKTAHALENAARDAAQTWVILVAGLREHRRCSFPENRAPAPDEVFVTGFGAQLIQEAGIRVLRQEPEEGTPRVEDRRRILLPAIFQQA